MILEFSVNDDAYLELPEGDKFILLENSQKNSDGLFELNLDNLRDLILQGVSKEGVNFIIWSLVDVPILDDKVKLAKRPFFPFTNHLKYSDLNSLDETELVSFSVHINRKDISVSYYQSFDTAKNLICNFEDEDIKEKFSNMVEDFLDGDFSRKIILNIIY